MAATTSIILVAELNLTELGLPGRIQLALVVADAVGTSPVLAANPPVKEAAIRVVKDGENLTTASNRVVVLSQQLEAAKKEVQDLTGVFDKDVLIYKALAEHHSQTVAELQGTGWKPRGPKATPVQAETPSRVVVKSRKKGSIYLHAKALKGRWTYQAEYSEDPTMPDSFKPMIGTTAMRTVDGFTSGKRYWVRVRVARGSQISAWSEPVPVVVL